MLLVYKQPLFENFLLAHRNNFVNFCTAATARTGLGWDYLDDDNTKCKKKGFFLPLSLKRKTFVVEKFINKNWCLEWRVD